jgi:thiol-disulfide isomerase/thioredoxin
MKRFLLFASLFAWLLSAVAETSAGDAAPVHLYVFWTQTCPHCQDALPFVDELAARHPWLRVHSLELTGNRANVRRYIDMAGMLGRQASSVPAFIFCGEMHTGYDTPAGMGRLLEERLLACRDVLAGEAAAQAPDAASITLPLFGEVDTAAWSLPLVTVAIAGLDAFNPCAFFVLLFLLSLLTHERTRMRMLVIGGVFVLFSGLVYFVLMSAWLNVFLIAGELRLMTMAAGLLAVGMALVNVKDYLWFKRGISLSIPDSAKPRLFERMRRLLRADSWPVMLTGAVTLAIVANSYEALCTAGFPMVYTRLLTLQELPTSSYYAYLAFYNVVYVVPLILIVLAYVYTLGSRKLNEAEGRVLKLVSGVMMLGLGSVLLVAPEGLNNPLLAMGLVVLAAGTGAFAWWRERKTAQRRIV